MSMVMLGAKAGPVLVSHGLDLAHQGDHGVMVFGGGGVCIVTRIDAGAQRRIAPVHGDVGGEVVGAAHNGLTARRIGKAGDG